jgi:hypothetical protein
LQHSIKRTGHLQNTQRGAKGNQTRESTSAYCRPNELIGQSRIELNPVPRLARHVRPVGDRALNNGYTQHKDVARVFRIGSD